MSVTVLHVESVHVINEAFLNPSRLQQGHWPGTEHVGKFWPSLEHVNRVEEHQDTDRERAEGMTSKENITNVK